MHLTASPSSSLYHPRQCHTPTSNSSAIYPTATSLTWTRLQRPRRSPQSPSRCMNVRSANSGSSTQRRDEARRSQFSSALGRGREATSMAATLHVARLGVGCAVGSLVSVLRGRKCGRWTMADRYLDMWVKDLEKESPGLFDASSAELRSLRDVDNVTSAEDCGSAVETARAGEGANVQEGKPRIRRLRLTVRKPKSPKTSSAGP